MMVSPELGEEDNIPCLLLGMNLEGLLGAPTRRVLGDVSEGRSNPRIDTSRILVFI